MKPITNLLTVLFFSSLMMATSANVVAGSIKKCQDANGQWHYGSSAARACGKAEIIEFKAGSNKRKVHKAPPTQEELADFKAKKREKIEEKQRRKDERAQDKLLAQSYAVEDDIIYERDRKIKDLQGGIDSSEATLASLTAVRNRARKRANEESATSAGISKNTKKTLASAERQVSRHERAVMEKNKELEEMKRYYDDALMRYRAMKQRRATRRR